MITMASDHLLLSEAPLLAGGSSLPETLTSAELRLPEYSSNSGLMSGDLIAVYEDDLQMRLDLWNLTVLAGNLSDVSRNLSRLWNASGGLNMEIIGKFERNRKVEGPLLVLIVTVYVSLIALGAVGNSLVVLAVIRKPAMRTARNVFIINLAISDLVLCLATTPFTLVEILTQYWPLGDTPFLCKLVGILQATSIFVSTISITAIALDRYQVILYPEQHSLGTKGALLTLPVIWAIALFLALPLFLVKTLTHYVINLPGLREVNFCYEEWPVQHGRAFYSVFVMLVQFCVPMLTVTVSYARIVQKLKGRLSTPSMRSKNSTRKEEKRSRKTNILLMTIALIFCLSWLPFHVFNIVVDFFSPFGDDSDTMYLVYAACHALGMSSACSNPVLYGWLNDNFRKEFTEIYQTMTPCSKAPGSATMIPCAREKESRSEAQLLNVPTIPSARVRASRSEGNLTKPTCENREVPEKSVEKQSKLVGDSPSKCPPAVCFSYLEEKRHYILNGTNGSTYVSYYNKCTQV